MQIIRNEDGTLVVPVIPGRHDLDEVTVDPGAEGAELVDTGPKTKVLHPGEGGYLEALAQWDLQEVGEHAATSTPSGRQEAMHVINEVAEDPEHDVHRAVEGLNDPDSSAEALRHVLVGGTPAMKAFAEDVAEAEGSEVIPPQTVSKIVGEVLAELDL